MPDRCGTITVRPMAWIFRTFIFALLTILTQIGGVAYLVGLGTARAFGVQFVLNRMLIFVASYTAMSVTSLFIAPAFDRVSLPCFGDGPLVAQSPLYCVLNRQYVSPEMLLVAEDLASYMAETFPGTQTLTLDANFPFFDGFPLLPHLSHDDGEKLDLAFYYESEGAYEPSQTRSPIGYWAFEEPRSGDPEPCENTSGPTLRWDVAWFKAFHNDLTLEPARTREALVWLSQRREVSKLFVEPHLKARLGVQATTIRFQGCRAARHDDHIHLQL